MYDILVEDVDVERQVLSLRNKNKRLNITMASIGNKIRQQNKENYCNAGKLLYLISDNVLLGDTGHNALIYFKYKIGTHIKNIKNDYLITGIFIKKDGHSNRKFYNIHCYKCGWDGYISEQAIDENNSCQCCSKEIIVVGINDIATTDSWAIEYFVNKEDAYKYHNSSIAKNDMICPMCGQIYNDVQIRYFFNNVYHLNCPCNKTYASYPERFVFNIFKALNIDNVISQVTKNKLYWADKYRYDFYIPNISCIIETHGIQHYQDSFAKMGGKTFREEQQNDYEKEVLARTNGINHYIVLDCRKSDMNWIKKSILDSELPELLQFSESDIDWQKCDKQSRSQLLLDVCKTYMEDFSATKQSLSERFGIRPDTVRRYLIQGKKLLMCDFDSNSIREKLSNHVINSVILIYKNGVLIRCCSSALDVHKKSLEIFGEKISEHKICYSIEKCIDINGCIMLRKESINSYEKYIDFLCDSENYYLTNVDDI